MSKKIIAVVGATGAQGGGLVRAILADPSGGFAARAITRERRATRPRRSRSSAPRSSRPTWTTRRACAGRSTGAHGAFCVTFFWDHFSPEKEQAEARAMAEAAKDAGVEHVIWSTLEDTRELRAAQRRPHADAHGQVQGPALRRQGRGGPLLHATLGVPTTFLLHVASTGTT